MPLTRKVNTSVESSVGWSDTNFIYLFVKESRNIKCPFFINSLVSVCLH